MSVGRVFSLTIMTLWLAFFLISLAEMMPSTTLSIGKSRSWVSFFLPQGWDFFTKNPRDEVANFYVLRGTEWQNANLGPKGSVRNAFGWTRAPRSQLLEVNGLLSQVLPTQFQPCSSESTVEACLDQWKEPIRTVNRFARPSLCGKAAVSFVKPLPWIWRRARSGKLKMPSRLVVLDVQC